MPSIIYQDTRYVVRPKKLARHTVSISTGRKKPQFSHPCSTVIPNPIEKTKLLQQCRLGRGVHIPNLKKIAPAISEIQAAKVWVFSSASSFHTLRKIRHKTRMRAQIGPKFGTLKGLI